MDKGNSTLKQLIIRATSWTFLGYGLGQMSRFAGNIIITRILPPSDFGIIQLVSTFVQGLIMFSDVGIATNIIQHKDGENPSFLRTAWTLQIIRGFILWLLTFVIAWPLAFIYQAPDMLWLLPIGGFSVFLNGFVSTNFAVQNRNLNMKMVSSIELTSNIIGVIAMVLSAWYWREIWVLLVPGIVSSLVQVFLSNKFLKKVPMRLEWHREYIFELIHFGKWIFFSSILTFLNARSDRIVLGLYLTKSELGLYGIAVSIVYIAVDIIQVLSGKILLPVYAHLKDFDREGMQSRIKKMRIVLQFIGISLLVLLAIWGQPLVNFIYPQSYQGAGWILRILAIGAIFKVITTTITPVLLGVGNSFYYMILQLVQCIILISFMLIGNYFAGFYGMLWGLVLTELCIYPLIAVMVKPYGAWLPKFDFISILLPFTFILIGLYGLSLFKG